MSELVKFKNVEVTFSTMLNKLDKNLFGRIFTVKVPLDSPQLKELQKQFKKLNETAKVSFGEKVGKKLRDASKEKGAGRDLFEESAYSEGFAELKFNIINVREKETQKEDGTIVKEKYEVINPIYKTLDFCYHVDNNGKKEYTTDKGNHWLPLNTNIIDLTCSLVASYDKKDNRPRIQLKADEVKILQSNIGSKDKGPQTGFLTLGSDEPESEGSDEAPNKEDMISADELATLDI